MPSSLHHRSAVRLALALFALGFAGSGAAATRLIPYLVKDIGTTPIDSTIPISWFSVYAMGDDVYAESEYPKGGVWHTDGSEIGTFRIGDANGADALSSSSSIMGGRPGLMLYAGGPWPGAAWATDGTTAGTRPISNTENFVMTKPSVCGTKLCFAPGHNRIMATDGTPAGTEDVSHGLPQVPDIYWPDETASNGKLTFFSGIDDEHGDCVSFGSDVISCGEPWVTDGTVAGTHLLKDLVPDWLPSSPTYFFPWNGLMYFTAFALRDGKFLPTFYVSDGTAGGTHVIADNFDWAFNRYPDYFGWGKYLYFGTALIGEFYRTDGTAEGIVSLRQFLSIPNGDRVMWAEPGGDTMLIVTYRQAGQLDFWSFDGTIATKTMSWPASNLSVAGYLPSTRRWYFIEASNGDATLYASDLTAAGTVKVTTLKGAHGLFPISYVYGRAKTKTQLFFQANNSEQNLWVTDGTAAGTHVVHTTPTATASSTPMDTTAVNGHAYFSAYDAEGPAVFATDGDAASVRRISCPGCRANTRPHVVARDGRVYVDPSSTTAFEWLTLSDDGNSFEALSSRLASAAAAPLLPPVRFGDRELFLTSAHNTVTLFAKGAAAPAALKEIPLTQSSLPDIAAADDRVFFTLAGDLWVSDGTAGGTSRLLTGGVLQGFTVLGKHIFFNRQEPAHLNYQCWVSDGTPAGTFDLKIPVPPGETIGVQLHPAGIANGLFYFAPNGTWRSDGTREGTFQVSPFGASSASAVDDRVALVVKKDGYDNGLHVLLTDGTVEGTHPALDVDNVTDISQPLRTASGKVLLPFRRPIKAGRRFLDLRTLEEINYDADDLEFAGTFLTVLGDRILFTAGHHSTGSELWAVDTKATRTPLPSLSVQFDGVTRVGNQRAAVFTVTMAGDAGPFPEVSYATTDGSARSGRDYVSTSGLMTFSGVENSRKIVVPVATEASGTFSIVLNGPKNAMIGTGVATGNVVAASTRRRGVQP